VGHFYLVIDKTSVFLRNLLYFLHIVNNLIPPPIGRFKERYLMAKGMTKSEVLTAVAEKIGKSRKEVSEFMETLVNLAYDEAKKSGEFTIPGLGKLLKKHREARMGRNPATGEQIKIPAKTVVKFRVAKAAKDSIL
jgi:DNA-binding protein HU-beta